MIEIVLFGIGRYLEERFEILRQFQNTRILYGVDNDKSLYGKFKYGIYVKNPVALLDSKFDYVVITSSYACDIQQQIKDLGISEEKIIRLEEYSALDAAGKYTCYCQNENGTVQIRNKSVAVVTQMAEFNGVVLAGIYLLMIMRHIGYDVSLLVSYGDEEFIDYAVKNGIPVCIYPGLNAEKFEKNEWVDKFEYLIFCSVMMSNCILKYRHKKVLWWIHDSDGCYKSEIRLRGMFHEDCYSNIPVCCVSDTAKEVFNRYFKNINPAVFEFGLPDFFAEKEVKTDKIVFAVVADIYYGKGQDILLKAVAELSQEEISKAEFWLIGNIFEDNFGNMIRELSAYYPVKFLGKLEHKKLEEIYSEISVVVCPSRQETVSISSIEAMMNKKITVVSDAAGISRYVENMKSAFVFESDNYEKLAEILRYIICNFKTLNDLRDNGRTIYEKIFSFEAFEIRTINLFRNIYYDFRENVLINDKTNI